MTSSTKKLSRRSAAEVIKLLQEKTSNGDNAATFCKKHGVSKQTFYNWQNKYHSQSTMKRDFIPVSVERSINEYPVPFCDLTLSGKTTIRLFQAVDAKFIKTLIAR